MKWGLLACFALVSAVLIYALYLDRQIRTTFDGPRWTLPANVYARPLELYPDMVLRRDDLLEELQRLGYRELQRLEHPGSFVRQGQSIQLQTRRFRFWDGDEPSQRVRLGFSGSKLTRLQRAEGGNLDLLRLDPVLIGKVYPTNNEDRVLVRYAQLPQLLVRTLVEVEDRRFHEHHGVDPLGVLRAVWKNLIAGGVVEGGSTLTQQLAKNFYLTRERSFKRKFNEALMALVLDWRYQKSEILEAYVNEIYLGQQAGHAIHGFGLASFFYFNRPLESLSLDQLALLVGIIKGPSYYNPRRHPERALQRRNLVLDLLHERGVVSQRDAEAAKARPLGVGEAGGGPAGYYPAFMDLVKRQLQRDYRPEDLRTEGLRVFTTLDPIIQQRGEKAVVARLRERERKLRLPANGLQAALVVADPHQGEVLAVVGGRDPRASGFNRALDANRQIGSLVKPFVYQQALAEPRRFNLLTRLSDRPLRLRGPDGSFWQPKNYSGKNHGEVPLYQALAKSYNLASVDLGTRVGIGKVAAQLNRLLANQKAEQVPSLLLGSVSYTPYEVTQLYQILAAGGFRSPLRAIRAVLDSAGNPLTRYPLVSERVLDSQSVFLVQWALHEVVENGTARSLGRQLQSRQWAAGKTGTSNDLRDSWFAGYTGNRVAVAWVGRDDNQPAKLSGSQGGLLLWTDLMLPMLTDRAPQPQPAGIEFLPLATGAAQLVDSSCAHEKMIPFVQGSAPSVQSCAQASRPGRKAEPEPEEEQTSPLDTFLQWLD